MFEDACIRSFVQHGAHVNFFRFSADGEIPKGVTARDAAEYATREESRMFTQAGRKASPASFANLFRYRVLAGEGGWWMDADVFCLKPAAAFEELERQSPGLIVGRESPTLLNNAVLYVSDRSVARALAERVLEVAQRSHFDLKWGAIGPDLITAFVAEQPGRCAILPRPIFYPVYHSRLDRFLAPEQREACRQLTSHAFTLHLWNEMLRRADVSKNVLPKPGSYLSDLFATLDPPPTPRL